MYVFLENHFLTGLINQLQQRQIKFQLGSFAFFYFHEIMAVCLLLECLMCDAMLIVIRTENFTASARDFKQLLDEVFVISGIIKVEVTLTETLIIPDITKTESNNCFIIHCFEESSDKRIIAAITVYFQTLKNVQLSDKQILTV